ncbi:MAG: DUF1724 domain-containing protein [Archaeoglobi archaeon]|nr:DUF1724 domain-containing protein [Archaeoglobi archaeon]
MERFEKVISLTTTSLKLRILEQLREERRISEIARALKVSRDTVKPHIRSFSQQGLVERCRDGYRLTTYGRAVLEKVWEVERLMLVDHSIREFFNTHDVSAIPHDLLRDIHMLCEGRILRRTNPFELVEEWVDIVLESGWVKGVSSVYHPEFPQLFTRASREKDITLILTRNVLEKSFSVHGDLATEFLKNSELRVVDDARVAFIVAEKGFAIGLYSGDSYDASRMYLSRDGDAIRWGLRLFQHFYEMSRSPQLTPMGDLESHKVDLK